VAVAKDQVRSALVAKPDAPEGVHARRGTEDLSWIQALHVHGRREQLALRLVTPARHRAAC